MLEYAPVPCIVRRGICKTKLQDFREKKIRKKSSNQTWRSVWTLYEISPNPVNSRKSGYLLTVPYYEGMLLWPPLVPIFSHYKYLKEV